MAEMVKAKVASGDYASESEVVRDGLRALQAQDVAVEKWLHEDVARSYDKHQANPQAALPAEDLMPRLRAAHRARTSKPDN